MKNLLTVLVFFIIFSCNNNKIFEKKIEINNAWNKNKSLIFNTKIDDINKKYDVFLELEHTKEYKFENIFFFVDIVFPNNKKITDTLECFLTNNEGKWQGSGWGSSKTIKLLYKQNIIFPQKGKYKFSIKQGTREDNLQNVNSIKLSVENNQSKSGIIAK